MKRLPKKITRDVLLALPHRKWDEVTTYDSLYIVPTNKKHDSGFALIAVIGVSDGKAEIAATCDDIGWTFPVKHPYGRMENGKNKMILRTDALYPSRIVHMWASGEHYFQGRFRVGCSLSSTDVELVLEPRGDGKNQMTGEVFVA